MLGILKPLGQAPQEALPNACWSYPTSFNPPLNPTARGAALQPMATWPPNLDDTAFDVYRMSPDARLMACGFSPDSQNAF
jgi:hypothetical protein